MNNEKGFTLLEVLILFAAGCLALSIGVVILNGLRLNNTDIQKIRDAKRNQDMTDLRTGLDLYFSQAGGYPDHAYWKAGATINCGNNSVFQVPKDPLTLTVYVYKNKGESSDSKNCSGKVWSDYAIQFEKESPTTADSSGFYCMTSTGTKPGRCQ